MSLRAPPACALPGRALVVSSTARAGEIGLEVSEFPRLENGRGLSFRHPLGDGGWRFFPFFGGGADLRGMAASEYIDRSGLQLCPRGRQRSGSESEAQRGRLSIWRFLFFTMGYF
jgi:hypothetical protein